MRTIGVIPARRGSKGMARKNLRLLGGKPLLVWTIEASRAAKCLDRVICTTDDEEIAGVARDHGCEVPFLRPPELANDDTPVSAAVIHALELSAKADGAYETVVTLQPTSPFRSAAHIEAAHNQFCATGAKSLVSVMESNAPPFWALKINREGTLEPLFADGRQERRRQELPQTVMPNGAIFLNHIPSLMDCKHYLVKPVTGYLMDRLHSLDIDSEEDLAYAEYLLTTGKIKPQ